MRNRGLLAAGAALAVVVVCAVHWWLPALRRENNTATVVPSATGHFQSGRIQIGAGQRVCVSPLPLDSQTRVARFVVETFGKPGPALSLTVRGPGYAARGSAKGGYADGATVAVPLQPAPSRSILAGACLFPHGRVSLVSTPEGRAIVTRVDGRHSDQALAISLAPGHPARLASRIADAPVAAARFQAGGSALVWIVLILGTLGAAAAGIAAVYFAFRR